MSVGYGQVPTATLATVLTVADVEAAAVRLTGTTKVTPVINDGVLNDLVGAEVHLKLECLQETGSFKFRGAFNAIAMLSDEQRSAGVVTYSSGNHAQAVAKAAQLAGTTAVVVMPHDAPPEKVTKTESFGARLVRYDRYTEDRAAIAERVADDDGRTLIPPYDHYPVMAGQGTVALELLNEVPDLDSLLVPVGGGGLLAGCGTVVEELRPALELYGVEPEAGDDHRRSRLAGHRVDVGVPRTIADGQQVSTPGTLTWPINDRLTSQFLTVSDEEIVSTMRLLVERVDLMVEPSGASALAALAYRDLPIAGKRVGVVISGGNIDRPRFRELTGT